MVVERSFGQRVQLYPLLLMVEVDANVEITINGVLEGGATAMNGPIFIATTEH